jgi:hypothetical protein
MAIVTYTLLAALAAGLQSRFHPEVLGVSFSKAMGVVVTEFMAIKLGCYLLDVRGGGGASGVELIGYGGYKFVGYVSRISSCLLADQIVSLLPSLSPCSTLVVSSLGRSLHTLSARMPSS